MSLKAMNEKIEHGFGKKSHSRKKMKKMRNKLLRRVKKTEKPNTKKYNGWEY